MRIVQMKPDLFHIRDTNRKIATVVADYNDYTARIYINWQSFLFDEMVELINLFHEIKVFVESQKVEVTNGTSPAGSGTQQTSQSNPQPDPSPQPTG